MKQICFRKFNSRDQIFILFYLFCTNSLLDNMYLFATIAGYSPWGFKESDTTEATARMGFKREIDRRPFNKWRAGGEGGDRGEDGWIALPTQWIQVWVNSGRWWRTGKSLACCSPWGHKELNMTEWMNNKYYQWSKLTKEKQKRRVFCSTVKIGI